MKQMPGSAVKQHQWSTASIKTHLGSPWKIHQEITSPGVFLVPKPNLIQLQLESPWGQRKLPSKHCQMIQWSMVHFFQNSQGLEDWKWHLIYWVIILFVYQCSLVFGHVSTKSCQYQRIIWTLQSPVPLHRQVACSCSAHPWESGHHEWRSLAALSAPPGCLGADMLCTTRTSKSPRIGG